MLEIYGNLVIFLGCNSELIIFRVFWCSQTGKRIAARNSQKELAHTILLDFDVQIKLMVLYVIKIGSEGYNLRI